MNTDIIPAPTSQPAVTLVTALAAALDLTDAEYRKLYDTLREGRSLRAFATAIGTQVSHSWWAKYEHGDADLDRARKNELLVASDLPTLPRAVSEIVTELHPDAAVYRVGDGIGTRCIIVGQDAPPAIDLHLNGTLTAVTAPALDTPHGQCHARYSRSLRKQVSQP